ncbi:hypothetical protein ROS60_000525 [Pluralibacter gergoviae]|uniref:hypothetical protein n=1 Tax=Pluralibacter gergoviae TaxID=61647 RepID=UPI002881BC58|nr:hypothetical protein [Pluralibacter gergoviae]ELK5595998.1 hypothetical protein [Pluralibacter gergoviae]MDU4435223.1 hypothetical protein [Pluralibacter gergoviae]
MALTRQSPNQLPDYELSRRLGIVSSGDDFDFAGLAKQLDCSRNFYQAGIIYSDGTTQWLVRPSRRIANTNQSSVSHVIVTKVTKQNAHLPAKAVLDSVQGPSLANEITSTVLSCGAGLITVFLALTATAAVPLTAGASGILAGVITAGGVATGIQCFIGGSRLLAIGFGHDDFVSWLDKNEWYTATSTALDIVSLAGAGAGLKTTIETYKLMKSVSSAKVYEWLKGLSRSERKRITEEIIRSQNPGISNTGIKAAMKAQQYPKRYPSEAIQHALQRELATALVNTSAFAGSAMTGTIRHPQNLTQSSKYIIGVLQSYSVITQ